MGSWSTVPLLRSGISPSRGRFYDKFPNSNRSKTPWTWLLLMQMTTGRPMTRKTKIIQPIDLDPTHRISSWCVTALPPKTNSIPLLFLNPFSSWLHLKTRSNWNWEFLCCHRSLSSWGRARSRKYLRFLQWWSAIPTAFIPTSGNNCSNCLVSSGLKPPRTLLSLNSPSGWFKNQFKSLN